MQQKLKSCRKTEDCLNDLKRRRAETTEEIDDEFDKMKEEVNDKMRETTSLLDKEVATLEENLTLLRNMKQNAEGTKDNHDCGFSDLMDTFETVKETVNQSFSGWRRYRYPQFFTEPVHFWENYRKTVQDQITRDRRKCGADGNTSEKHQRCVTTQMHRLEPVISPIRLYASLNPFESGS